LVERIDQGQAVHVIEEARGWSLLDRMTDCWVSTNYLGETAPRAAESTIRRFSGEYSEPARPARRASGRAYYRNCAAARAAGAAPVLRGEAGYSRRLDRDGDGVGCE
jgi:hypothetical protein